MAYATVADVKARTVRAFSQAEEGVMGALLEDAAAMILAACPEPDETAARIVSCRMVLRAMGDDPAAGIPIGASQGSMTAGPYNQQWTFSSGAAGELYLGKADRALLGLSNRIGASNPFAAPEVTP